VNKTLPEKLARRGRVGTPQSDTDSPHIEAIYLKMIEEAEKVK
jgi:hypothetical protein